jgi:signal transduction histidine kinase
MDELSIRLPEVAPGCADPSVKASRVSWASDSAKSLETFIQDLPSHADVNSLLDAFVPHLQHLAIASLHIFAWDPASGNYFCCRSFPPAAGSLTETLDERCPLIRLFQSARIRFLGPGEEGLPVAAQAWIPAARSQLARRGQDWAFPLLSRQRLLGLLLLGQTAAQRSSSAVNVEVLISVINHFSLFLDILLLNSASDLMGSVSPGIAHDIQNLLTPIGVVLQLGRGNRSDRLKAAKLWPVALDKMQILRKFLDHARVFAPRQQPRFALVRLDLLLQQAARSAMIHGDQPRVEVIAKDLPEITVEADEVLILRLLSNLLSNALNASPPGAEVRLVLEPINLLEGGQDLVQIQIIDQGRGFNSNEVERLLAPPFARPTDNTDSTQHGLGLAICRQIVAFHGGQFHISGVEHEGTTVRVILPRSHPREPEPNNGRA